MLSLHLISALEYISASHGNFNASIYFPVDP